MLQRQDRANTQGDRARNHPSGETASSARDDGKEGYSESMRNSAIAKPKPLTTHDVAHMLQVDASTVSKWIDKNLLLAYRTPGGHRRVRTSDLRKFLEEHNMPVPDELAGRKVRLLAVDDEPKNLRALSRALHPISDRLEFVTTTSAIDGLLKLGEERFDGLLVDLEMPELDGLEVIRRVRAHSSLAEVTIVAMTTSASAAATKDAIEAGAALCLKKPVDIDQGVGVVQGLSG